MDRLQLLNDSEAATIAALDGRQARIWTALPCIVQSVDLAQMTITAQPAIQGTQTDQDGVARNVNLPLLVDVPICFPSAGGFTLTLPIKANDEVLIILASRCIDAWWQNGGVGPAPEFRMHDLSDGFAIPGPKSVPKVVPTISSDSAQLRSDDGTTYLEINSTGIIKLTAPSGVNIVGDLTVSGNINASEVTAGSIPLSTHLHPGVTTGSGDTGAPIP